MSAIEINLLLVIIYVYISYIRHSNFKCNEITKPKLKRKYVLVFSAAVC